MFNFFVKVVRDFYVFFLYWKEARGACVLWRTADAPAYPVRYARYGRTHTGNLPTLGWEPPTIGRTFIVFKAPFFIFSTLFSLVLPALMTSMDKCSLAGPPVLMRKPCTS